LITNNYYTQTKHTLISGRDIQEIQFKSLIALDIINKLFMTTGLSINVKKTKIMILSVINKIMPLFKFPVGINQYKRK
jgi:hypothetical protein